MQVAQATSPVLYVNPQAGTDGSGAGTSPEAAFKTITYALQQVQAATVIQLAPGTYSKESGETFPLVIPSGVTLKGEEGTKGKDTIIKGNGEFVSPTFARQNIAVLAKGDSQILGVTITAPITRGTALWIETGSPLISNCTLANSNRDGIFVSGNASPKIYNNTFTKNAGNGISIAKAAQADVRGNLFQETGFGLAIGGTSTPQVSGNQIIQNEDGIVVSDSARPVLRDNLIEKNGRDGIVVISSALPDLGNSSSAGNNTIRSNKRHDLYNATRGNTLVVAGNTLDTKKISGKYSLVDVATAYSGPLRDIQGHWAQSFIEALAAKKVITGFPDGTYRPSDPVTRAQFATIISKAFEPGANRAGESFRDVPSNLWAFNAIQTAYRGGFMSGYPGGQFLPDQAIPRVQVLVALSSGLNLKSDNSSVLAFYQDASQIPSYATTAVAAATEKKIVVNYPEIKTLNPTRNATRAEVAAFVYQALVNAGKAQALQSPYVVAASK
jgi:parallel beta-helix repeat protein